MAKDPALDQTPTDSMQTADWRALLSPVEFAILRESATERPGTGRYLNEEGPGAYHCSGCGNRLYAGAHKFHSGCGRPSFFQEVEEGAVTTYVDHSHGMTRTEMGCGRCDGHLGHIFPDAPQTPTGKRHCVNGFALIFVADGEDPQAAIAAHRTQHQG